MKTLMIRLAALVGLSILVGGSARALDFSMTDPTSVVGTIRSGEPSSIDDEVLYVNYLLSLGANTAATHDFGGALGSHDFQTSGTNYDGTVSAVGASQNGGLSGSGFTYILAKYDGPNGGDVVWFVGGAAFTLPGDSSGLWTNPDGQGYGISHWTGFGPGTSVADGGTTAALLGLGLVILSLIARRPKTA